MNPEFDKQLSIITEEGVILKLCLHLLLFYREKADQEAKWPVLLDILDEHNAMTGNSYRWTTNPNTEKWKRLKNGISSYLHPRDWLPSAKKGEHFIVYHAGEQASDASDVEIRSGISTVRSVRPGYIEIQFPVDQFDGQHSGLPELAQKWCSLLKPEHGYGGFRLAQSHGYENGVGALHSRLLSSQFQGVDVGSPLLHRDYLRKSIKGADWLTIISDAYVDKLDGKDTVKQAMGKLPVLPYNGGLILQAGIMPLLGDVKQQQDMSAYRQVARVVEPIRCKDRGGGFYDTSHGFTAELYREWLARFSPQPE